MNFYKHHLGDYDGATAHLTWDEDMAYTRLLRVYYRREAPISIEEAHRLTRATSKAQRAAVDCVLREFFEKRDDGWHNKRADEEIAAYQAQASTNKRIARQRWGDEPSTNRTRNVDEPSTVTVEKRTPNQNQIPEPDTRKEQRRSASRGSRFAEEAIRPSWREFCETERPDLDAITTFKTFRDYWIAQPGQKGVKTDWDATWRNWVRKEAKKPNGNGSGAPWWASNAGIEAKAAEVGVTAKPGESWNDLKARVSAAMAPA